MAQAADQYTPVDQRRTLNDVVCYFTEELGCEKDDPALRWKIWEQFLGGRLKLERHWKKYLRPEGGEYVWASEVVDPSHYRSHSALDSLGFDQRGHLSFVGDPRYYTVVEPCDFRAIWPPPAHRVPNVLVPQVHPQRPRIVAPVRQRKAAGVAKHVPMHGFARRKGWTRDGTEDRAGSDSSKTGAPDRLRSRGQRILRKAADETFRDGWGDLPTSTIIERASDHRDVKALKSGTSYDTWVRALGRRKD
jgi:hypothetical protein